MHKPKSGVVVTYSKRKQVSRIVKDNWSELECNSIECREKAKSSNPLTSTPIGKPFVPKPPAQDLKPLNLLLSGSLDTPHNENISKGFHHPREINGKRACRRSPTSSTKKESCLSPPQTTSHDSISALDSQIDLFTSSNSDEKVQIQDESSDKESLALIDKTDFVFQTPAVAICEDPFVPLNKVTEAFPDDASENFHDYSNHAMDEKSAQLSMEMSKMSIQEDNVSVLETSKGDSATSVMEMSIEECISTQQIAVLDRELMLTQAVPSLKKLLSQCRRVRDLETMVKKETCIKKIGEGTFGEVFMGEDTVYKVIPVGGTVEINDAEQTNFENAFQEIVVSRKLSDLAGDKVQMGKAFCQLKDVVICGGKYPNVLLDAWDDFKGTENERPDRLPEDQLYVVLLARYSGIQLEDYCSKNKLTPDQAHSVVRQLCCSLAAAEQRYEFEHRDLHWGNVLISDTTMSHVEFTQDGKNFILKSHGLLATIIDFTFSRLETEGCLNFVDLEQEDWLFQGDAKVDIQYRVYRDMRSACRKNWSKFTPRTNVLWILYLIDKMNVKIKSQKLRRLKQSLQSCKSASLALPVAFRSL